MHAINDKKIALIGKKGGRLVYELTRTVSDNGQLKHVERLYKPKTGKR